MQIVTYARGYLVRLGAMLQGKVVDLNWAYIDFISRRKAARPPELSQAVVSPDIIGFLDGGEWSVNAAQAALDYISEEMAKPSRAAELKKQAIIADMKEVKLIAPVPRPRKLLAVGRNYKAHAKEGGHEAPIEPIFFSKCLTSVIGQGEPIILPKISDEIDYEIELAYVVGKKGRNIKEEDAYQYIAGYTILNDVSARDIQRRAGQWMLGKSFDSFAPMGPWLTTKDEIPDPHKLRIKLELNGKIMQDSNTSEMIFNIPKLIAHTSAVFTIEPGDVVATGTPEGVGFARKPPVFLKAGDSLKLEIEGIGKLENPVKSA